jgi:hypothetical protein
VFDNPLAFRTISFDEKRYLQVKDIKSRMVLNIDRQAR